MAGVYIHIPFCHGKCAYCDFYSQVVRRIPVGDFVRAITHEWHERRHELDGHDIETLYIGGGTPSILPDDALAAITSLFRDFPLVETTIETNPEDVDPSRASAWRSMGINRVSMGVQSLMDNELRAVGRRHTAAKAIQAYEDLRHGGFDNISLDLIYGLPQQTVESWRHSLDTVFGLRPEHLSAYCLTIEPRTPLGLRMTKGQFVPTDDDTIAQFYQILCDRAADAGMEHYEISNLARSGYKSRHNSSYWVGTPYLGLGPGAHSLDAYGTRRYVEHNTRQYIASPGSCLHIDPESAIERTNDTIMTGLRTSRGIAISDIAPQFREELEKNIRRSAEHGDIVPLYNRWRIPEERWLLADAITCNILL